MYRVLCKQSLQVSWVPRIASLVAERGNSLFGADCCSARNQKSTETWPIIVEKLNVCMTCMYKADKLSSINGNAHTKSTQCLERINAPITRHEVAVKNSPKRNSLVGISTAEFYSVFCVYSNTRPGIHGKQKPYE